MYLLFCVVVLGGGRGGGGAPPAAAVVVVVAAAAAAAAVSFGWFVGMFSYNGRWSIQSICSGKFFVAALFSSFCWRSNWGFRWLW